MTRLNDQTCQPRNNSVSDRTLLKLLVIGLVALLLLKLFLASRLDLYSDEIFYWLASRRLALAYSDLPFMTSLLAGLGSTISPTSTLAVRSLFILLGSSIPLLVYWLALPITGRNRALMSALLALCIPLGGFLGLLAVPDVPLLFFGLLSIALFERSLRTDCAGYWLATGLTVALGLCTHYRFLLYPAAAGLFLLFYRPERRQWRNPLFWLAVGLASTGLLPIIWFNLGNQLASASFYLVERHPWTFQATGLMHVFKQAGLVTPPLYGLFAVTLWRMLIMARDGNRNAALLACFALTNLLVYLLLAPWTDASSTSIHWPLSGYFPILVFAPATLAAAGTWARTRWHSVFATALKRGIPALGYCGSVVALAAIGSQAYQQPLQAWLGTGVLSTKMAGWPEFSAHTSRLLAREFPDQKPIVVTDNYYSAAQLLFAGVADQVFTTDRDKAVRDGRRRQLEIWEMTESALAEHAGKPSLYITEDSTLTVPEKETSLGTMCRHVAGLRQLDSLSLFNGGKRYSYYGASRLTETTEVSAFQDASCPYPAWAWIDTPVAGAELSGVTHLEGWAFKEDIGLRSVQLLLNDEVAATLNYGISRPDVVTVMDVDSDPNAPDLGFDYELDTRRVANGRYRLSIRLTDNRGVESTYGERTVSISN